MQILCLNCAMPSNRTVRGIVIACLASSWQCTTPKSLVSQQAVSDCRFIQVKQWSVYVQKSEDTSLLNLVCRQIAESCCWSMAYGSQHRILLPRHKEVSRNEANCIDVKKTILKKASMLETWWFFKSKLQDCMKVLCNMWKSSEQKCTKLMSYYII